MSSFLITLFFISGFAHASFMGDLHVSKMEIETKTVDGVNAEAVCASWSGGWTVERLCSKFVKVTNKDEIAKVRALKERFDGQNKGNTGVWIEQGALDDKLFDDKTLDVDYFLKKIDSKSCQYPKKVQDEIDETKNDIAEKKKELAELQAKLFKLQSPKNKKCDVVGAEAEDGDEGFDEETVE